MIPKTLAYVAGAGILFAVGYGTNKLVLRQPTNEEKQRASGSTESDATALADPDEAVRDFKRLYAAIDGFRKTHKRLPKPVELQQTGQPIGGVTLAIEDFQSPLPPRHALAASRKPDSLAHYRMPLLGMKGPDGKNLEAFPKQGRRDVWVYSPLSASKEIVTSADGTKQRIHRGSYVVLFSDGKIEKIQQGDLIHYQHARFPPGTCTTGFPGMGGVSKFHSIRECPKNTRAGLESIFQD